jgi:hypothetical protein
MKLETWIWLAFVAAIGVPTAALAELILGPASEGPNAISGYTGRVHVIDLENKGRESWDDESPRDLPSAMGGIEWKEKGDKPCEIWAHAKSLDNGKNPQVGVGWTALCNGNKRSLEEVAFLDKPRYYVSGIQVCTTRKKDSADDRLKGIRIYASKVTKDGEVTPIDGAMEQASRTNCDEPWHARVDCPAGEIAGGLKIYYSDDVIRGLSLRCHPVRVRDAAVPADVNAPRPTPPRILVQ